MAELYLIEFKGSRKEYFFNTYYHSLKPQEHVIVQAERGEDVGVLSKKIEIEMTFDDTSRPRSILRPASNDDLSRHADLRQKELQHKNEVIELIKKHRLVMKVVDVEWQFDGNKMTVFFTADHRVDFRELVKDLAARYKTRIELRQIGVRDEARRIGGTGICGLQQCCNSFIRDFKPISTQHAREQDLPLNPSKISGNCGRLLCCLRYEAELYETVKRKLPSPGSLVKTNGGDGVVERVDVFTEEIVVRLAEGDVVRVRLEDILEVDTRRRAETRSRSVASEFEGGALEDEAARQELKKLDDSENLN